MRKIGIIIIFIFLGCDSPNGWDCLQTAGNLTEQSFDLENFNKIRVNRNIELILKQGDIQEVVIRTGENLLNDVSAEVIDGQLIINDDNNCNFVRDFGITKAYVTSPNITEILCSTQFKISSDGVLAYEELNLISENFEKPDIFSVGDFELDVNCQKLNVYSNGVSIFRIRGTVEDLFIGFYSGLGRFEGENLISEKINILHDGSNDMIVNPQQELSGEMRGTGDIISHNTPPLINIDEFYTGRLIFVN
jgi:hypothetical protein